MSDDNVITKETMTIYIAVLEKHVQQMSAVVSNLEELDEKITNIENHFHNGFKSDLMDHSSDLAKDLKEQVSDLIKEISVNKESFKEQITALTNLYNLKTTELKSSLRVDRAINIVGWSALIVTIVAKLFGKG